MDYIVGLILIAALIALALHLPWFVTAIILCAMWLTRD
jgi:hypothetical protein